MTSEQRWPVSITMRISEELNGKLKEQGRKEQSGVSAVIRRILAQYYGLTE